MDVQKFPERILSSEENGKKEFQIPLADSPDQVLTLHRTVFCFVFLLLSEVMIF